MDLVVVCLSLAVGLLGGWLVARQRAARELEGVVRERTGLEVELGTERARHAEALRSLERQTAFLEDSRRQLEDAFGRLAQQALERNDARFAALSAERMAPLKAELAKLQAQTREIEQARASAQGSLVQQLGELARATATLNERSGKLESALRGSAQARGRWGELTLRNVVETAGMAPHCDFIEQEVIEGGTRPDMIVRLPGGEGIPVDSKTPLSNYWLAMEAEDPLERRAALRRHADDVRRHVLELGKRDYSGLIQGRVDYTVLFLTGDPLLAAAFEHRPDLLEEALSRRVLIATPVTLVALLRTASILWQQKAIDENARLIADGAREFYRRVITFQEHVERIGGSLDRARDAYNRAAASFQSRVLPAGRRLEELGGPAGQQAVLGELSPIEGELRRLPATETQTDTGGEAGDEARDETGDETGAEETEDVGAAAPGEKA